MILLFQPFAFVNGLHSLNSCHLGSCNCQSLLISHDLGPCQLRSCFSIVAQHILHKVPFAKFLRFTSKSFVLLTTVTTSKSRQRGHLHATVVSISVFSLMQINYFRWDKKRADPMGFYRFASLMINFRRYLLH